MEVLCVTVPVNGIFTTPIDHEMEMTPKGAYVLMLPVMYVICRRNLRLTVDALKRCLEAQN